MAGEHGKMMGNSFFACQIPNAQLSIMGHMHSVTYMDSQIPWSYVNLATCMHGILIRNVSVVKKIALKIVRHVKTLRSMQG